MGPLLDAFTPNLDLPPASDVVIVGGGIIGISAALFLAEQGLRVVVIEKGHVGAEQSSRNWGWCRQLNRDPREFELIRESLILWHGLNERIGSDTGFRPTGIAYGLANDRAIDRAHDWTETAADAGISADVLSGSDMARLIPGDTTPPKAIIHCDSDGRAEPQKAVPALARAAQRKGAIILEDCAARGLEVGGGHILSVVTERGAIRTSRVVVAAGAWSRRFLADVGIDLPQLKVRASVLRTSAVDGPAVAFSDGGIAFRKRLDGGYTVADGRVNMVPIVPDSFRLLLKFAPALLMDWNGLKLTLDHRFLTERREARPVPLDRISPYERVRVLDPEPDHGLLEAAFERLAARFPAFKGARIVQRWAGMIDATPDAIPVISPVDAIAGLVVATGFSGHGFGIGPGAGRLVADIVAGVEPLVDPRAFRLTRFTDGSRPRPAAGI